MPLTRSVVARLVLAALIGVAMLDPLPYAQQTDPNATRLQNTALISKAFLAAVNAYPHANHVIQAKLLALANGLQSLSLMDAPTRASLKTNLMPWVDRIGPAAEDPLLHACKDAFVYSLDGSTSPKLIMDGLSIMPRRGARVTSPLDEIDAQRKLRALMKKVTGF